MAGSGFVRAGSGMALNRDQALVELAKAARELLLEVAGTYRGTITYRQLAADVQKRAGVRAGSTPGWLVEVLSMVVRVCHRLAEPPLTSLVVHHTDGTVGPAYDEALRTAGLSVADADAREDAAAAGRLECYRRYAPNVPPDAVPTRVTPQAAQRTPRLTTAARGRPAPRASRPLDASKPRRTVDEQRAPFVVCSACFLQTPPGAECQNCGAPLR
nr:hypothetical protein [Propionibacterium sp.]